MKKRTIFLIILSVVVVAVALFVFFIPDNGLHIMDCHIIKEGFDNYHPSDSDVSLCEYLTFRNGFNYQRDDGNRFEILYPWKDAFYRYEDIANGGYNNETVLLSFTYEEGFFEEPLNDICSQPGFSDDIVFQYNGYSFFLNNTEGIANDDKNKTSDYKNYCLTCDEPYIYWINLAGYSLAKRTLVFIGFYHNEEFRTGFWSFEYKPYYFKGWSKLLDDEFGFYSW